MGFFNSNVSRLYAAQFDLSSYLNDINGLPGNRPLLPVTAFPDLGDKFTPGREGPTPISLAGLWDDTATLGLDQAIATLKADSDGFGLTYFPEQVIDKPAYLVNAALIQGTDYKSTIGSVVEGTITLEANSASKRGKVLLPLTAIAASADQASVDSGVTSVPTGLWNYHITAVSVTGGAGTWDVDLEDSADDAAWAQIDQILAADVTPTAGSRVQATVRRYARLSLTLNGSSGSISIATSLAWDANS